MKSSFPPESQRIMMGCNEFRVLRMGAPPHAILDECFHTSHTRLRVPCRSTLPSVAQTVAYATRPYSIRKWMRQCQCHYSTVL
ncbi:fructose-bisphosphatase [Anopheles sinensis]|uniref:Fructose-bisphosphatase n=1 Tax=Anopheles sinensis TaxID=74873 RepID=A0A084WD71_ANOSI|nr:fructose-bisphosphatase [Anopheles sinensis]